MGRAFLKGENMKKTFCFVVFALAAFMTLAAFAVPVRAQETPNMKSGLERYYAKDFKEAEKFFRSALEEDRGNSMAIMYLTDCAKQQKALGTILNEYEEKALAAPSDPYIKCYLGFFYFCKSLQDRDDVFEEASNMFKEALKLNPNLALGYNGMGTVYYQKRLMPRARSYFAKAIKLDSNDSMSIERLGDIYMNDDKNYGAAKGYFEDIIALYPSYPDAYFFRGSACQKEGDVDEAIRMYKMAAERDPNGLTQGYYAPVRLGDVYYGQGEYAKAIEAYEKALDINPNNSYVLRMIEKARNPEKARPEDKKKSGKDSDKGDQGEGKIDGGENKGGEGSDSNLNENIKKKLDSAAEKSAAEK